MICKKCKINKLNLRGKICYICRKKQNAEYMNEYRKRHPNYNKEYNYKNKEKISKQNKIYRENNKEKINKQKNNYRNKKYKEDPIFKLRRGISIQIKNKKTISFLKYLPYTLEELKIHLEAQFEPWMNWGNRGSYNPKTWNDSDVSTWTWHIDHIIPKSSFNYTSLTDTQFKECWSLKNLRPLSAKINIQKGSKLELVK